MHPAYLFLKISTKSTPLNLEAVAPDEPKYQLHGHDADNSEDSSFQKGSSYDRPQLTSSRTVWLWRNPGRPYLICWCSQQRQPKGGWRKTLTLGTPRIHWFFLNHVQTQRQPSEAHLTGCNT